MATFEEACKAVDEGKKVHREYWYSWLSLIRGDKEYILFADDNNGRRTVGGLTKEEKRATDWVIEE